MGHALCHGAARHTRVPARPRHRCCLQAPLPRACCRGNARTCCGSPPEISDTSYQAALCSAASASPGCSLSGTPSRRTLCCHAQHRVFHRSPKNYLTDKGTFQCSAQEVCQEASSICISCLLSSAPLSNRVCRQLRRASTRS